MNFNIIKNSDGTNRFELNGIHVVAKGYTEIKGLHYFNTPSNAVAYFNIKSKLYSLSNKFGFYKTAEEFYEAMIKQFTFFKKH